MIYIIFYAFLRVCVASEAPINNTVANYDANELLSKIFNFNDSMPRAGYGLIKFRKENYQDFDDFSNKNSNQYNDINNENLKFYDDFNDTDNGLLTFQENNNSNKKKRKRKQRTQNYGFQNPVANGPVLGFGGQNVAFAGHYHRPPRPRPSIASSALTAVTDALTSIALYDDSQCVARLLCEAAGGGALGSSGILQTVSGLQPLLTLLSTYNGISTNPLFVFGRAVFLGMSSNGNTASCRYGYPLCPTDPEQLVHYLNNHNGGFFRFFNAPHLGQQNIEQFYDQLSQNYGLQPSPIHQSYQQNYGFYDPSQQNNVQNPNLYSHEQNYGLAYPYNYNNVRFQVTDKNLGKIQRRIQNKPNFHTAHSEDFNSKWTFPNAVDENNINYVNSDDFDDYVYNTDNFYNNREIKNLKFPDNNIENNNFKISYNRQTRGFTFPESQSNMEYNNNNNYKQNLANEYASSNYYVNNAHYNSDNNLRDVNTVYVVRGNGDPNHPEIIQLRPGETVQ